MHWDRQRGNIRKDSSKTMSSELVSASHLVRLLDTILSRSGAQASLEVTERSVFFTSYFVLSYFNTVFTLYSILFCLKSKISSLKSNVSLLPTAHCYCKLLSYPYFKFLLSSFQPFYLFKLYPQDCLLL